MMFYVDQQEVRKELTTPFFTKKKYGIENQPEKLYMNMLTDRDIMAHVHNGNIDAFDVLIDRYKNRLINYAFLLLHDYYIAQDIVQETFLRFLRKRQNINNNIRAELFSIASKMMKNKLRHRKISIRNNDKSWYESWVVSDEYLSNAVTQMAFDFLQSDDREVIILRDIEGMSYSEISDITDESIKKVKNRINEARMKLCDYLL